MNENDTSKVQNTYSSIDSMVWRIIMQCCNPKNCIFVSLGKRSRYRFHTNSIRIVEA